MRVKMALLKIGDQLVVLTLSKTKVDVDHAGLSLLQLVLKMLTGELVSSCSDSQNSSLLIVIQFRMDVMVDGPTEVGIT